MLKPLLALAHRRLGRRQVLSFASIRRRHVHRELHLDHRRESPSVLVCAWAAGTVAVLSRLGMGMRGKDGRRGIDSAWPQGAMDRTLGCTEYRVCTWQKKRPGLSGIGGIVVADLASTFVKTNPSSGAVLMRTGGFQDPHHRAGGQDCQAANRKLAPSTYP